MAVAVEDAVEHYIRSLLARTNGNVKHIATFCGTSVEEYLRSIRGKIRWLGSSDDGHSLSNIHLFHGQPILRTGRVEAQYKPLHALVCHGATQRGYCWGGSLLFFCGGLKVGQSPLKIITDDCVHRGEDAHQFAGNES